MTWELAAIVAGVLIVSVFFDLWRRAQKYNALKPRLDRVEEDERKLRAHAAAFELQKTKWERQRTKQAEEHRLRRERDLLAIRQLSKEKAVGFPWLAQAYADWFNLRDLEIASHLEHKTPPAPRAADNVREIAAKRRESERLLRIYKYQIAYYESLVPWLIELKDTSIDDSAIAVETGGQNDSASDDDAAKNWLTPGEYKCLPTQQKFQMALDRWRLRGKKSPWQIGRDYERYVGYVWQQEGFDVEYRGIFAGLQDMGIDLLARRGTELHVIQCKRWAREKTIHEKHIFQLFGTAIECCLQQRKQQVQVKQLGLFPDFLRSSNVVPILVTTTALSDTAKDVAEILNVEIKECFALEEYPCIKCNISTKDGSKIYHLPFDQQYDKVVIEPSRGECWVSTVAEAESRGFRRAMRWRGSAGTDGYEPPAPSI